jgi:hypothetical protein
MLLPGVGAEAVVLAAEEYSGMLEWVLGGLEYQERLVARMLVLAELAELVELAGIGACKVLWETSVRLGVMVTTVVMGLLGHKAERAEQVATPLLRKQLLA